MAGVRGVPVPAPMWDTLVLDLLRPRAYSTLYSDELAKVRPSFK